MIQDVATGVIFVVSIGLLVRLAIRGKQRKTAPEQAVPVPVTLLGVVPAPRPELIIDSLIVEP